MPLQGLNDFSLFNIGLRPSLTSNAVTGLTEKLSSGGGKKLRNFRQVGWKALHTTYSTLITGYRLPNTAYRLLITYYLTYHGLTFSRSHLLHRETHCKRCALTFFRMCMYHTVMMINYFLDDTKTYS